MAEQIALVTGASRGIGAAIVAALLARGMIVYGAARSHARRTTLAASQAGDLRPLVMDVAEEAAVEQGFARIRAEAGRLDVLVNNAGIGRYGELVDFALADFDAVMAVNVRGTFCCCQQAMRLMRQQRSGYIINIASVVGSKGYPQQAAYTASKHAVMGLTKSLAVEAQAHEVRVSAVLPGGVDTEMVAQARPDLDRSGLIRPADVAEAVCYLLDLPASCAVDQIALRRYGAAPF